MNFVALNDDVKFIISKHLALDLKIRKLLSNNHDLGKKNLEMSYITMIFVDCDCMLYFYTYVCMHLHTYVCTYVSMYLYTYACTYICRRCTV
jgi:hypothetical protein